MKIASMVLGIVGGAMVLIVTALMLFLNFWVSNLITGTSLAVTNPVSSMFTAYVVLGIAVSAAGITGGILVRRTPIISGALMLSGAVLCFISIVGIFAGVLLLIGGIFAFIRQPVPTYSVSQAPPTPSQLSEMPNTTEPEETK